MPLDPGPQSITNLDPQEYFNKSLETVDSINTTDKANNYTDAELCRLRDACSLEEAEMITSLSMFHKKLLSEGHTKIGTKAVLTQEICLDKNSDDRG